MIKRLFAILLTAAMLSTASFTALAAEEKRDSVQGSETYSLELEKDTALENAKASKSELSLDGGFAKYQLTLPFYSDKVRIKSKSKGKKITLKINDKSYEIQLSDAETEYTFDTPVRVGEKDLEISAEESVSISDITFLQITEEKVGAMLGFNRSDFEEATKTAYIIRQGSPVIMVNSALRYIDYDDISAYPAYFDGSLYIPADTLAQALGCYFENDKDKGFCVVRNSELELVYLNGKFTFTDENGNKTETDIQPKYVNDKMYLPLRAVSELFGRYVYYKDGFVAVDYRSRAKDILDGHYDEVVKKWSELMPDEQGQKTYYVAQTANANDSNPGTKERPFRTIEKAGEIASAGDIVIIGGGIYREMLKPQNDGTAGAPITFKAAEGEEVTLSALEEVSGFADYKDGIAVASVSSDLGLGRNQVFYKGKNLIEARYPNPDVGEDGLYEFTNGLRLDPIWITPGDIKVNPSNTKEATSETLLNEEDGHWNGAVFVTQQGAAWTLCSAIVKNSTKGKLELKDMSDKWWFNAEEKYPNYGYLTCHINCIDLPGEWTIKNNMLYIMPPEGETAKTLKVSMKKRQLIMDLNDRKNIRVEGIKGVGGGVRMDNAEMCVIDKCDLSYISHYTYFKDNRNLFIDDGDVYNPQGAPQRGEVGIFIGGENNAFVNSKLNYSAGAGLFITGSYAYIANNVLENLSYGGTSCGGVHMDTEMFKPQDTKRGGHTIIYNTISKIARNAVELQRSEGTGWGQQTFLPFEVAYNDIYDSSICTLDTGMIYLWGARVGDDFTRTEIHNNYVYSTAPRGEDILGAIYNDNFMVGTNTYDNLIFAKRANQFNNDVYEQRKRQFATTYATVDSWNNVNLDIKLNARQDLRIEDYPDGKPFNAGSTLADNRDGYTLTYDYYTQTDDKVHGISEAKCSDGVVVKDNKATFTADGQWIKFENVDFGDTNCVNIVYTADYYKDACNADIVVGDDIDEALSKGMGETVTLYPESKNQNDSNHVSVDVGGISLEGKQNVWIRVKGEPNASITQMRTTKKTNAYESYEYDYKKIIAGTFAYFGKGITAEGAPKGIMRHGTESTAPILQGSWGGNWVEYKNVKITEPVNTFTCRLASGAPWNDNGVNIRLDSVDGEVLARVTSEDSNWEYVEKSAPLSKTIQPGTYDIYLTFDGDGKCSDIHWFGLK